MLSDKGSGVIRKFGILNTNVPPDVTRFYGIPFPGQYLIAPDGIVKDKLFLPDYQERPTASEVLLKEFGTGGNSVMVKAEDVSAKVTVSDTRSYSGHRLGVSVAFEVAPNFQITRVSREAQLAKSPMNLSSALRRSMSFGPGSPWTIGSSACAVSLNSAAQCSSQGSGSRRASSIARHAASGRRAHHKCSVFRA